MASKETNTVSVLQFTSAMQLAAVVSCERATVHRHVLIDPA
ncbi:MAG: hypothetical protein ABJL55_23160 [Roseibium sp.]